ncbi:JAB domain-containing protein [Rhodanobacter caeni]|uniref:DNA repair protein RadC n=1 Tax=Rhodanobacter caeni TaxID=657654 RepID=A0ABN0UHI2_9GAMM
MRAQAVRRPVAQRAIDGPTDRDQQDAVIAQALTILAARALTSGQFMKDPPTAGQFFRLRLGEERREHFEVAFLDNRHRLIAVERLFSGSVDGAEVHARVVVQRALALNAVAVMLAHNHPSGNPEPSPADQTLTARLREALGLVDIRVLDHFVVTATEAVSLATRGLM